MKKFIKNIILIILLIFFLTGCTNPEEQEISIKDKTEQEIEYIEDMIFNITNKYAKGEYIKDDGGLDWKAVFEDEKRINNILETVVLDLTELDISNDEIIKLSSEINNLLYTTATENEVELLTRLNNLYALVPNYFSKVGASKTKVQDKELYSMVLASYSLANAGNWEEAKTTAQSAIDKYNGMMNDVEYMQENSYKLNRIYIMLNEVKNAIDTENMTLINLKFVSFIERT